MQRQREAIEASKIVAAQASGLDESALTESMEGPPDVGTTEQDTD
jgi:hypothetical protein